MDRPSRAGNNGTSRNGRPRQRRKTQSTRKRPKQQRTPWRMVRVLHLRLEAAIRGSCIACSGSGAGYRCSEWPT